MDGLAAFWSARLDEDEAAAKAAWGVEWDWRYVAQPFGERPSIAHTVHIARHDPARVLRGVAADRRILQMYDAMPRWTPGDIPDGVEPSVVKADMAERKAFEDVIRARAAVFGGHPDYRPEWAPGA